MKRFVRLALAGATLAIASLAYGAQLSTEARAIIPHNIEQLVVIDYKALQTSKTALELRSRILPPELKEFEDALTRSGLNENHDIDILAFAMFESSRSKDEVTIGIAQGQFSEDRILSSFKTQKIRAATVRDNKLYSLPKAGMVVCFIDSSTMLFGGFSAVKQALDAHDGEAPNLLSNEVMVDAMKAVDSEPLWSIYDGKGTQDMVRQMLGGAGSIADFDEVRSHLLSSSYSLNFVHGIDFELRLNTGDQFAASTISSLLNAAVAVRKIGASDAEKEALSDTTIDSDVGRLAVRFKSDDQEFSALMQSPLFQGMLH